MFRVLGPRVGSARTWAAGRVQLSEASTTHSGGLGSTSLHTAQETSTSGREANSASWLALSSAAFAGAGAASFLWNSYAQQEQQAIWDPSNNLSAVDCQEVQWVKNIAADSDNAVVLSASTMHKHPLLKQDHMFAELHRHGMVQDLVCFYNAPKRTLTCVLQLGKNICGFPKIVHGGLTAAIIDECFGFHWLSLRSNGQLQNSGPHFTAHLEVDYKQKIPAGRLLMCTTEVESIEDRKLWMKATIRDGPSGKVYATSRALFVCPRMKKLIEEGVKYAYRSVFS